MKEEGYGSLLKEQIALYPEEQMQAVSKKQQKLWIGVPRETTEDEARVTLKPEAVMLLTRNGHEVLVESNAGQGAKHEDKDYIQAGAKIAYSAQEVFESNIILKIEPPTPEEIEYLKPNTTIISALQLGQLDANYLKKLSQKKVTAVAYEFLKDQVGNAPVVRAMSEIAGSSVTLIAAEYLSSARNGKGLILGGVTGVPPTKVVIIGAGTVAEYAARTAIGLGAEVKIFDKHIYKLRRLKYAIGSEVYTSTLDELSLSEALSRADVVIGAVPPEKGITPLIVTEEMVSNMKPDSVIIDVSIDQGGCVETSEPSTHRNPTFRKYDIIHYCVPNIASRVAQTSSNALSNIFTPYLLEIGNMGGVEEMIFMDKGFMEGVYSYKGGITNKHLARKFHLPYKDLNLVLAARI